MMRVFTIPERTPNSGWSDKDLCKFYSYLFTNGDNRSFKIQREEECSVCRDEEYLIIHHIIPFSEFGKHEDENLLVLCEPCHYKVHYGNLVLKQNGDIDLKWKYQYEQFLEIMKLFSSLKKFKEEVIEKMELIHQCRKLPYERISHIPMDKFVIKI